MSFFTNELELNRLVFRILQEAQGFLLPYKKQFFICDADFINFIGFDADNPDWSLIAYDWIKPANTKSWSRLNKQLKQLKRARLNS